MAPLLLTSAVAVEIALDLGVTRTQLGVSFAAPYLTGALAAPHIGRALQRVGPAVGARVAAAITALSLALIGTVADDWRLVALLLALSGLGTAMGQLSTNLSLAESISPDRRGLAFGAKESAVPLAGMMAGLLMPLLVLPLGWRTAFCLIAIAALVGAAVSPPLGGPPPVRRRPAAANWRPDFATVALAVSGLLACAIGNSLVTFTVDASFDFGFSQGAGALILAAGSLAAIGARLGLGLLADLDRIAPITIVVGLYAAATAALLCLAVAGQPSLFTAGAVVGIATGWGWPGLLYYAVARRDPAVAARSTGFLLAFFYIGAVVGPVLVGAVADHRGYGEAWLLGAAAFAVATAAAAAAKRATERPAP